MMLMAVLANLLIFAPTLSAYINKHLLVYIFCRSQISAWVAGWLCKVSYKPALLLLLLSRFSHVQLCATP